MTAFETHTVRFFVPEAKAIHCAALNAEANKLAVSRSDNAVELWDVGCVLSRRGAPVCQARLPPAGGASVEALAWAAGRLFSTGLHGHVLEHGGHGLEATASTSVSGTAAWCLAADPAGCRLAAGTEDGQVIVHAVTDEGLVFERRMAKQERRILCVAWSPDGTHLAAGSVNAVCLHQARTGAQVSRITVGRQVGRKETLVWSVALLADLTIVTGDSRGRVSFWNGPLGALHTSLGSHRADVLAVTSSADGERVFAAGVDPTVARFERIPSARATAGWVRSLRIQLHVRDVRVMISTGDCLISAGVDADLVFDFQGNNKDTVRTSPLPQLGTVLPAPRLPGLVTVGDSELRLWRLPAAGSDEQPVALLQLSSRRGEPPVCAAVSADAGWLAYSTPARLRLHRLETGTARPSLQRVRSLPPEAAGPCRQLAFSPSGDWLLLLTAAGRLVRLRLTSALDELSAEDLGWADGREDPDEDDEEDEEQQSVALNLLTLSADGQRAALADRDGGVLVWDLEKPALVSRMPRRSAPATALAFRPDCATHILAAYADRSVAEFDTAAGHLTGWSRWAAEQVPEAWQKRPLPVRHITVTECGSRVLLHDDSGVCALDAAAGEQAADSKRAKTAKGRRKTIETAEVTAAESVVITDRYRHLLYLGSLAERRLLAVEAPAARVEQMLPPALRRKRYGVA
ncbi:U3 small nucleolar RNA-associated protein 4 homolog [Amphibalanus amphitrite]|uniref:U3 small nucleolar RNA-associated protein 4 homolog n=1 Tax=Amphibalanus amphitrite TaxID=1232801 RepID=UPI001C8FF500|nr:U3 small nucleolar RNA-associated protein 4 homolog [Amphibalanus amphitrite]XP_043218169.1 U3 small nucleolar RNA-associated protein 4 homolog [Amphibalanus amphitrite]XP_043218170.1 U3 small nucleolar RNA-associated protein 4 homolog [Amphibalanus amphitrite]XP_043218171.1 U3 small nucleolar RNA-associated protein 4 homolog [Amphibalanus amphitrite]